MARMSILGWASPIFARLGLLSTHYGHLASWAADQRGNPPYFTVATRVLTGSRNRSRRNTGKSLVGDPSVTASTLVRESRRQIVEAWFALFLFSATVSSTPVDQVVFSANDLQMGNFKFHFVQTVDLGANPEIGNRKNFSGSVRHFISPQ